MEINLNERWTLGSQLGSGGFGKVYKAENENSDTNVAIKLIPKEPGADRELLFENLKGVRNIVPIIDSGEFENYWVLVMPLAEKSLRDYLEEKGNLSIPEALSVLSDIAVALSDIQGSIVHRDLKPENVLLLNGHWCLSDFGISRYAEASTVADTHKFSWTGSYNAPERWQHQRATSASDMYSLGIIGFELITGTRPFPGIDSRQEHLIQNPPFLNDCPTLLTALITQCLMKAPAVRPLAKDFISRLDQVLRPASEGASLLQSANLSKSQELASEMTARSATEDENQQKFEIVKSATQLFSMTINQLKQSIHDNAPSAKIEKIGHTIIGRAAKNQTLLNFNEDELYGFSATLGSATLTIQPIQETINTEWGYYKPAFQVLAYTSIRVQIPPNNYGYQGREHSIWFCDVEEEGVFHWYETAYMITPVVNKRTSLNPFSLLPGEDSGKALGNTLAEYQVAWPFMKIEVGNENEFLDRWMGWFAKGVSNKLSEPSYMPEIDPYGTWRQ
ncbi:serine/threonine protein kinase [Paenibacillus sp. CFBP13512]|uniref:serine/threonine-protein kinase n=1 Tax=Paenibacillus sp. CFBP13512 TaxID=2184007 RepID=UPI0010C0B64C|nr:serine/threonine-protein kinase [Paenibacillus sp. CFBP13512]TKJ83713.1 serine/threonine protein kinase [Paenibacillus sp. CFBP13512]